MCGIISLVLSCCFSSGADDDDEDAELAFEKTKNDRPLHVEKSITEHYGGRRTKKPFSDIFAFASAPVIALKSNFVRDTPTPENIPLEILSSAVIP